MQLASRKLWKLVAARCFFTCCPNLLCVLHAAESDDGLWAAERYQMLATTVVSGIARKNHGLVAHLIDLQRGHRPRIRPADREG